MCRDTYMDLIGKIFERLTVLSEVPIEHRLSPKCRTYKCACVCGGIKLVKGTHLRTGEVRSCGCLQKDTASATLRKVLLKHGLSKHPIYRVWVHMIDRCTNPENIGWKNYGGRGITVCHEWLAGPESFIEWAKAYGWQKGLEIDRKNNNGPYAPENCQFVIHSVNQKNKRGHCVP